jgi:hypothetical protein
MVDRGRKEAPMDEALRNFREIPSKDVNVRKEVINQELLFIRKKWDSMDQERLEEKLKLEYEMYQKENKFEMFRESEKDLILSIALGDFRLKLEKGDIRKAVKIEILKATLEI